MSWNGALYDAAVSAQTFGEVGQAFLNPIDFDGVTDVNIAKAAWGIKSPTSNAKMHFWIGNQKVRTDVMSPWVAKR